MQLRWPSTIIYTKIKMVKFFPPHSLSSILDNTENEELLWACFCLLPRHVLPVLIELDIIMNESVTRRLFMFTLSNICLINGFQHSVSAKHCKICLFLQRFRKWLNQASFVTVPVIRWDNSLVRVRVTSAVLIKTLTFPCPCTTLASIWFSHGV